LKDTENAPSTDKYAQPPNSSKLKFECMKFYSDGQMDKRACLVCMRSRVQIPKTGQILHSVANDLHRFNIYTGTKAVLLWRYVAEMGSLHASA